MARGECAFLCVQFHVNFSLNVALTRETGSFSSFSPLISVTLRSGSKVHFPPAVNITESPDTFADHYWSHVNKPE